MAKLRAEDLEILAAALGKTGMGKIVTAGLLWLALEPMAFAEPLKLACYGEMHESGGAYGETVENYSTSITVDVRAGGSITTGYGSLPILGDVSGDNITFLDASNVRTEGATTASLNRVTGAFSLHVLPHGGGLLRFYGVCKHAEKLF